MKKLRMLRHSNKARDINKRPATVTDVSKNLVPFRTVRNLRRGHLIGAMRDINHVEWESWEQDVTEMQRMADRQTLAGNNRFYNALMRAQVLLAEIREREQELQAINEEMEATNEELQATNEEMEATNEEMEATNEELQATSEELAQAGAYVRSLIEANLDALVTIGEDGKIADVNSATVSMTGSTRDDLIGTAFSDYFTDPEKAEAGYQEAFREGLVKDYPLELRHRDGHRTPVLYNASVFRDEAGKIRGVLAAARDVTEQQQAEAAVRLAYLELNQIFDTAADGMRVIDMDFNVIRTNKTFETMADISKDRAVGRKCYEVFSSPLCHTPDCPLILILEGEKRVEREIEKETRRGGEASYILTATPFLGDEGKLVGIVEDFNEISELKEVEKEIRRANAYNRSLIEANLDPIATIDASGKITDVNSAKERITGHSRDELIGSDFTRHFTEPEKARAGYETVLKTGSVVDYPLEFKSRDGRVTPVLYNASVYRNEAGEIRGVLAAARDVTAIRRAEDEAKQKSEALARSNTELQNFAYGVSHDLKEPLRVVNAYVQQLAEGYEGKLDTRADELIRHVKDGADKMRGFIDGLLAYAGVGTEPEDFEPVDCDAILETALSNLGVAINESGAKITHDPLPAALADRLELGQLFQNLIANAIKFRGKEPPRIHISGERIEDSEIPIPQSAIRIPQSEIGCLFSVKDNGIGIEQKGVERIFQIFERGHRQHEFAGSGIGLALCKKVVERHNGNIWVTSTPGEGSTFYFTIPCEG